MSLEGEIRGPGLFLWKICINPHGPFSELGIQSMIFILIVVIIAIILIIFVTVMNRPTPNQTQG